MTTNTEKNMDIFLRYLEDYRFIAHRLGFIMQGYPENSFANLVSMFNDDKTLMSSSGVEFDIQFTADHVPMVNHDICMADISNSDKKIPKSTYEEIKDIECGYRKSTYDSTKPWNQNNNFSLQTLETFLSFFMDNRSKLGDRIIKVESKYPLTKKEDMIALKEIFKRYCALNENIMHISFFPWNIKKLRDIQHQDGIPLTRTELLVDFKIEKILLKLWASCIDGVALGLKEERSVGSLEIDKKAQSVSDLNAFFYERRSAVSEEWLRKIIATYGYAGIYTINTPENINELFTKVSPEFLKEYSKKLIITSDDPLYFKRLRLTKLDQNSNQV